MKRATATRLCLLLLVCCSALSCLSYAQTVANKRAMLSQARESYYNLRTEGLVSFECSVTPNWELLLRGQRTEDPSGTDTAIQILSQLHFTVNLGADDKVKLTHNELTGQSQEMMDALKPIYSNMEEMTSRFFDTWSTFMLNSPFPEVNSEYGVQAVGPQYKLTYRDGLTDIVTTMGRDFAISDQRLTTPESDSVIQPQFTKSPKGFLFSAYDESYQSKNPGEARLVKVRIGYQEIQGLELLQKLDLSGSDGGSPFAVQLAFSDCKLTKKPELPISRPRPGN